MYDMTRIPHPFTVVQLIDDEGFVAWVQRTDTTQADFWQALYDDSERRPIMAEAATLVRALQFKPRPAQDTAAAWAALQSRLDTPTPATRRRLGRRAWLQWAAAAASLLLVAATALLWSGRKDKWVVKQTDYGKQLDLRMGDATRIRLNANSTLAFAAQWAKADKRKIHLKAGQAYFQVTHTPDDQPLEVRTQHFTVTVLGTAFDVMTRTDRASVVLQEGAIRVDFDQPQTVQSNGQTQRLRSLLLAPDDCLRLVDGRYYKTQVNTDNHIAWVSRKLVLDHTSMAELATIIQDLYGVTIVFGTPDLAEEVLTGTVALQDLDGLLLALQEVFGLSVETISAKRIKFVKD